MLKDFHVYAFCFICRTSKMIDCSSAVVSMEFAPDVPCIRHRVHSTSLLAIGLENGQIQIWNSSTGMLMA